MEIYSNEYHIEFTVDLQTFNIALTYHKTWFLIKVKNYLRLIIKIQLYVKSKIY